MWPRALAVARRSSAPTKLITLGVLRTAIIVSSSSTIRTST
jgi:hypothetical protein